MNIHNSDFIYKKIEAYNKNFANIVRHMNNYSELSRLSLSKSKVNFKIQDVNYKLLEKEANKKETHEHEKELLDKNLSETRKIKNDSLISESLLSKEELLGEGLTEEGLIEEELSGEELLDEELLDESALEENFLIQKFNQIITIYVSQLDLIFDFQKNKDSFNIAPEDERELNTYIGELFLKIEEFLDFSKDSIENLTLIDF